jgi:hypothetical protein
LPHGIPELIYHSPEDYGALDFKASSLFRSSTVSLIIQLSFMQIGLEQRAIDHVRGLYINQAHPVFDLVPPTLGDYFRSCYERLGHHTITRDSVWGVYLAMLHDIQKNDDPPAAIQPMEDDEELRLLENHDDLPFVDDDTGFYYMGGVRGGRGLGHIPLPFHVTSVNQISRHLAS